MIGMVGTDETLWHVPCGVFCPGTPLASDAGMEVLTGKRDLAKVKRDLDAAGYKGEKVVVLTPTDIASAKALADITADSLRHVGMNVDAQAMDWATLVQRRAKMDPVEQGGWSIFHTSWSGLDHDQSRRPRVPAGQRQGRGAGLAEQPADRGTARRMVQGAGSGGAEDAGASSCSFRCSRTCRTSRLGSISMPTAYQAI